MRRMIVIAAVLVIVVVVASFVWLRSHMTTPGPDSGTVIIQIERGQTAHATAQELHRLGLIHSAKYFYWNLRLDGNSSLIKSGEYEFETPVTPKEIIFVLARGDEKKYDITIPEGSNLKEIKLLVIDAGICSPSQAMDMFGDLALAEKYGHGGSLEGYLFPSTYRFAKSACGEKMVRTMRKVLDDKIGGLKIDSLHQTLTLASITEKETAVVSERRRISGVYANRLKRKMKLQADPTVIYGIKKFRGNIRRSHLKDPHPYNTYVHRGLPPGPIASPGLAAIKAAVDPESHKYLYFVAKDDGTHAFCQTYRCHQKAVRKWQLRGNGS